MPPGGRPFRLRLDIAERFSLGTADGYVWVLPAVIAAVWILSWWRPLRSRWLLLLMAFAISVLCFAYGVHSFGMTPAGVQESLPKGDTFSSKDFQCSPFFECLDRYPVFWLMASLPGITKSFTKIRSAQVRSVSGI